MAKGNNSKKGLNVKVVTVMMLMVLIVGCAIGGTVAWLLDTTNEVKNTFTPSTINIDLEEKKPQDNTAKMVPGNTIDKDPKVTVQKGSEACWLFVKVTEEGGVVDYTPAGSKQTTQTVWSDFLDYKVITGANGWKPVPNKTGFYYREVDASTESQNFNILEGNKVTVKNTVTKEMMDALKKETYPTLTFMAAAVQQANITNVELAWDKLPKEFTGETPNP